MTTPTPFDPDRYVSYHAQSGDTLAVIASHFEVAPETIFSPHPLPARGLLTVGQLLLILKPPESAPYARFLLPDSEVVNSPCGGNFNVKTFVEASNGRLSLHTEVVDGVLISGPEIVRLVSQNTSTNPRLLLAFIEYRSHWVLTSPPSPDLAHPLGLNIAGLEGLFPELSAYAQLLNIGYYGWRLGKLNALTFREGGSSRISPALNAGSAGLQYLFARMFRKAAWEGELYGPFGFLSTYRNLFGDPLGCAQTVEPLFPDGMISPTLELPFAPGEAWVLTGGPHENWDTGTPWGALDFAPITGEPPCQVSQAWVRASASGVVTRSERGVVQLTLLDDKGGQSGWELVYMHVAEKDRVKNGSRVLANEPVGHPSCEGGYATGTHVHLARMYRGEWIGAGDPFPYILSGWTAIAGEEPYQGTLVKGEKVVVARPDGSRDALITR